MMDQRVSEQQYHRLPSADDICFILSLVRNPNNFIAEHHHTTTQSSSVHKLSSSWQHTLTLLPGQRREIILALNKLATARQKWGNVSKTAGHDVVNELQQRYIEPDVFQEFFTTRYDPNNFFYLLHILSQHPQKVQIQFLCLIPY